MRSVTAALDYLDSLDLTEYDQKLVKAIRQSIADNNALPVYRHVCCAYIPIDQDMRMSATICQETARHLPIIEYVGVWDALKGCARTYQLIDYPGGQDEEHTA